MVEIEDRVRLSEKWDLHKAEELKASRVLGTCTPCTLGLIVCVHVLKSCSGRNEDRDGQRARGWVGQHTCFDYDIIDLCA